MSQTRVDCIRVNVSKPVAATAPSITLASRFWPGATPSLTVLVHGWADGAFVWNSFLPLFLRERSALTVDLRGHGDSPWDPGERYTREAHVADLVALVDRLEHGKVVLVGHSIGADFAIHTAAQRPHRLSALVIVDGGPELNERAALAMREHLNLLAWRYRTVSEFAESLADRYPLAERAVRDDYASSALRRADDDWFDLKADPALRANMPAPDNASMWSALENLACPIMVVRGALSSFLSQRHGQVICRRVPHCRLVSVALAGHSVPLDKPAALNDAIGPFLAEVVP